MRDGVKFALLLSGLLAVFFLVWWFYNPTVWIFTAAPVEVSADKPPVDLPAPSHFEDFVAAFGPPSMEEETHQGKFRRPMATKWLDYEPEHIRVAFIAADTGEYPPRREWIAISYMDSIEARPLSAAAAGKRLSSRRK